MRPQRLRLDTLTWSPHQLVIRSSLDALQFQTVYWYPDSDLLQLERRFGRAFMERLFVHAALFEINKIASLRPQIVDLGPYAAYHTVALESLWRTVFQQVWAQWRFENNLPHEPPPRWASQPRAPEPTAVGRDQRVPQVLLFCGGGKDSLVTMRLLERAAIPFASFAYSSSIYGPARAQHRLIDGLLDLGQPERRHRQIVLDDFFDAPVLDLVGAQAGVHTLTAAETPSSIFASLPILLQHGYSHIVLGHEASANRGNLTWAATGEEVNHQWGKSRAAERLLHAYVQKELVSDLGIFSLLMPIFDVVIFELLRKDEASLAATHSCNVQKPWCRRCPKCAYVWLSYRAHLSREPVEAMFPEDLLEAPGNQGFFADLLGLGAHTPFECVGQIEESRLALALCGARGLLGPAGQAWLARLPPLPLHTVLDRYTAIDGGSDGLPAEFALPILSQMQAAATAARQRILKWLG